MTIKIPKTAEQAVDALAEVSALVTAKEWERAAIVAALVGSPEDAKARQHKESITSDGLMTVDVLAAKGIIGLRTQDSIRRYRDAWCKVRPDSGPRRGCRIRYNYRTDDRRCPVAWSQTWSQTAADGAGFDRTRTD